MVFLHTQSPPFLFIPALTHAPVGKLKKWDTVQEVHQTTEIPMAPSRKASRPGEIPLPPPPPPPASGLPLRAMLPLPGGAAAAAAAAAAASKKKDKKKEKAGSETSSVSSASSPYSPGQQQQHLFILSKKSVHFLPLSSLCV